MGCKQTYQFNFDGRRVCGNSEMLALNRGLLTGCQQTSFLAVALTIMFDDKLFVILKINIAYSPAGMSILKLPLGSVLAPLSSDDLPCL